MNEEIKQLIEELQTKAKDAPQKVKAYLAERSLVVTEAIVTNNPDLPGIVKQELLNVKGMTAIVATEQADSLDNFAIAVFSKAITVAIAAMMNV